MAYWNKKSNQERNANKSQVYEAEVVLSLNFNLFQRPCTSLRVTEESVSDRVFRGVIDSLGFVMYTIEEQDADSRSDFNKPG